jgi:hypothetical protein
MAASIAWRSSLPGQRRFAHHRRRAQPHGLGLQPRDFRGLRGNHGAAALLDLAVLGEQGAVFTVKAGQGGRVLGCCMSGLQKLRPIQG